MRWFLNRFRRPAMERQLDAELRFHIEEQVETLVRQGISEDEARRNVRLQFGGIDQIKDECRDVRPLGLIDDFFRDVRIGTRSFLRAPAFTVVTILTLTVGIGATTAVYTAIASMVVRPLPFPHPDRLLWIRDQAPSLSVGSTELRMSEYREWRERTTSIEDMSAYHAYFGHLSYNLTGRGEPERLSGIEVSSSLFRLLGTKPATGRLFTDDEDLPGAARVVVLTDGLWRRRFGGLSDVVGQPLTLNEQVYTVVGVLPREFRFNSTFAPSANIDVFVPLVRDESAESFGFYLAVLGRLRQGRSAEQAQAELASIHRRLEEARPFLVKFQPSVVPLSSFVSGPVRSSLRLLGATVVLLLLLGCANLANLFLARGLARIRELGIRLSLGAARHRLIRQLAAEALIIAAIGGTLGTAFAYGLLRLVPYARSLHLPRLEEVHLDPWVIGFVVVVSVLSSVLFGILPAISTTRVDIVSSLKEAPNRVSGSHAGGYLRAVLVSAQTGLALVLLVAAGLLIRSFERLLSTNPGFRPDHVLAMRIDAGARHPDGTRLVAFFSEVYDRVSALPSVESTALVYNLPLDRDMMWDVDIPGEQYEQGISRTAHVRIATSGYLRTMSISIEAGRDFSPADDRDHPDVVIVNQSLARIIAPYRQPLGSTINVGGRAHHVIGIVSDVRHSGLDREAGPEIYLSYAQSLKSGRASFSGFDLVVRTRAEPQILVPAIRHMVWSIDSQQPVGPVVAMTDLVDRSVSPRRFVMLLSALFSVIALAIAAAGVYGVVNYTVGRRIHEIGIRMAVGATAGQVQRMILGESLFVAGVGVLVGIIGSVALLPLLSSQIYGIKQFDFTTFVLAPLVLLSVAVLASVAPVWRATRLDPRSALLHE